MASVDKRVVEMKFDNAQFERETSKTMSTLGKLKSSLGNMVSSASSINIKTNATGLQPLSQGVDALVTKFSALQIAGVAAIANIANKAVNAGTEMVKSLTVAPIQGGLAEYEKKIGSIQTVLANTQAAGTNLEQVSGALNNLNEYSDKTIYNFGEMARNIGTFTAAGVDLETATGSIKGIANLAALSGSSSEQASTAMYQLSQAISAGKVSLMDWNSVVNAGMGGSVFQRALAETGVAMGKLPAEALKLEGAMKNVKINGQSFRESISAEGGPSWLTSDVLTAALQNFTGDMKLADLTAQGFSASQAEAIMAQATLASDAATKVKTASQLMNTLKETAESGWAQTWELIIGDFNEAPKVFTGISNAIGGIISGAADSRNKLLADWGAAGGRQDMLDGLINAWTALKSVVTPVIAAFRDIFPATTGQKLADISEKFRKFTEGLILGEDNMENLKRTFRGIFAVFGVVTQVIKGIVSAIFSLFPATQGASGGFLAITAIVGDFLYVISRILTFKDPIGKFFDVLVSPLALLKPLITLVVNLAQALSSLFSGKSNLDQFLSSIKISFAIFGGAFDVIGDKFKDFFGAISGSFEGFSNYLNMIARRLASGGNVIGAGIITGLAKITTFFRDFTQDAQETSARVIKSFTDVSTTGANFLNGIGGSGLDKFKTSVIEINDKLVQFREKLNVSENLSTLNASAGSTASGGMSALAGVMTIAAAIWAGISGMFTGLGNLIGPFLTEVGEFFTTVISRIKEYIGSMDNQELVAAINTGVLVLLYVAFKKFVGNMKSTVGSFTDMAKSIGGTFDALKSSLSALTGAVRASIVMQIAIAVGVLVAALFILAKIDSDALNQALITLGVLFAQMAAMMLLLTKIPLDKLAGAGTAMIAVSIAVLILSHAIQKLGEMDQDVLIQGGIAIASILAALARFSVIMTMAPMLIKAAIALVILSAALTLMAGVIALYSVIPLDVMMQGLAAMAATMLVLGLTLQAFPWTTLASAVGIAIIAKALILLSGALAILGMLPIEVLAKGLLAIAGMMIILAVAAHAMTGSIIGAAAMFIMAAAITALVPALALLGALPFDVLKQGLLAIAAIMAIFVIGMYALTPVIAVLALFATSLLILGAAIVLAATGFFIFTKALGVLLLIGVAGFAVIAAGITTLLALFPLIAQQAGYAFVTFVKVIRDSAPKLIEAWGHIFMAFIHEIARRVPEVAQAGLDMIIGILEAIRSRIGDITNTAIDIVVIFIETLRGRLPDIIQAGLDFIISFIEGLAEAIRGNRERTGEAGADLATALIEGLVAGLESLWDTIRQAVIDLGNYLLEEFKDFFGVESPSTIFAEIGGYLVQGLANGIRDSYKLVKEAVINLAEKLPQPFRKVLGLESPSKVFAEMGKNLVQGLAQGLDKNAGIVETSVNSLGGSVTSVLQESLAALTNLTSENMDMNPTITPVFDLINIKKGSAFIDNMMSIDPVSVSATVIKATEVSSGYNTNQSVATINSLQMQKDIQAVLSSISLKASKSKTELVGPRPVEFHIGTIQDGDSLLRRARATNRMLSLAEGGDSAQLERIL